MSDDKKPPSRDEAIELLRQPGPGELFPWLMKQLDRDAERLGDYKGYCDGGVHLSDEQWAAEIDVKRRLIKLHEGRHWCTPGPEDTDWKVIEGGEEITVVYPCLHLRLFGSLYAARYGYRDEWRPR